MSQASRWAERRAQVERERPDAMEPIQCENAELSAAVTDNGRIVVRHGAATIWVTEPAALALARWIEETCGGGEA